MCGIAGSLAWEGTDSAEPARVSRMLDLMAHRGPDGRAVSTCGPELCWGAVRLAIVDPAGSAQPLRDSAGELQLLFNGEIYNYRELRSWLAKRGHRFMTEGDGEVIIELYREDPAGFAARLDGMFAFALWDRRAKRLIMGRDRCGIKPLLYWQQGTRLIFSSEAKGLLAHSAVPLTVSQSAVADYIDARFVFPPGSIFSGVRKVPPGAIVVATPDGVRARSYWNPADPGRSAGQEDDFPSVLTRSVATMDDCSGGVSVFLSGGIDSATVAALTRTPGSRTVSVGYGTVGTEDERARARAIADQLGLANHEVMLAGGDVLDTFRRTIWHLEEPVYTPTALSTFALGARAAQLGKVALSGDGADELLLGYEHFRTARQNAIWQPPYWAALGWMRPEQRAELIRPDLLSRRSPPDVQDLAGPVASHGDPADLMRAFEFTCKLPEYHLTRIDRLTMAHGLEVRVPFLRNDVVTWALTRPAEKLLAGPAKQDLRAVPTRLPEQVSSRPKQKFTAPAARWLAGPLRPIATDLLEAAPGADDLGLDVAAVRKLARSFAGDTGADTAVVWGLTVLFGWYELVFRRLQQERRGFHDADS